MMFTMLSGSRLCWQCKKRNFGLILYDRWKPGLLWLMIDKIDKKAS